MATTFSLHNSTASAIVIDDVTVTATVPAYGNVVVDAGNSVSDVLGSFKLRDFVLAGQLGLIVNGRQVDYAKILKSQAGA
jgi:hypothetical protein